MNLKYKGFDQLTTQELYSILQLRSEIFVVEQNCVYQDLDGKDDKALHVLGTKNGNLVAYTRIFGPNDYFREVSIGRVLVKKTERENGYGKMVMKYSIEIVRDKFKSGTIHISAQKYLEKFYSSLGFTTVGEGYLEDGIPHITMVME